MQGVLSLFPSAVSPLLSRLRLFAPLLLFVSLRFCLCRPIFVPFPLFSLPLLALLQASTSTTSTTATASAVAAASTPHSAVHSKRMHRMEQKASSSQLSQKAGVSSFPSLFSNKSTRKVAALTLPPPCVQSYFSRRNSPHSFRGAINFL